MRLFGLSSRCATAALVSGLLFGCSGVASSDLTTGSGGSDGGSRADGADTGASPGPGTPEGGGGDTSVIVTVDTGAPLHEAAAPPDVRIVTPDTGPKPHMESLTCPTGGSDKCMGYAPIACCVSQSVNITTAPTGTCQVPAEPASCTGEGKAEVACASSIDCEVGEVCCGEKNQNDQYVLVSCRTSCDGGNQTQFCTGHPSDCGMDQACNKSAIIPPYEVCY